MHFVASPRMVLFVLGLMCCSLSVTAEQTALFAGDARNAQLLACAGVALLFMSLVAP
jgi:hypothetical protein